MSKCANCDCPYDYHGTPAGTACNWCGCRQFVPLFSTQAIDGNARRKPQDARVMQ